MLQLLARLMFLLGAVCVARTNTRSDKVSCKDEEGRDVDWFYLYKLPKHFNSDSSSNDASGQQYLYITSRYYTLWQLSKTKISQADSLPAVTLNKLFTDPSILLIAYNDEFPNGTTIDTGGHTKGVVATDGETGIWIIHSIPKFPSIPGYEYPSSGEHYGQSFLCLTLKSVELNKVGEQLIYNEVNIYYTRVPLIIYKFPNLERAIQRNWKSETPFHNIVDLETMEGTKFKSFAKGSKFNGDLYKDLLAPTLDVNLFVESWRNGPKNMPSNCSGTDKVYNIADIEEEHLQIKFKTTADHSKWAVSQQSGFKLWHWSIGDSSWICVGDINRQIHQMVRGGGTVCQNNIKLTTLYRELVESYEHCGANA